MNRAVSLAIVLSLGTSCDRQGEPGQEIAPTQERPQAQERAAESPKTVADKVVEAPALTCEALVCSGARVTDGDAAVLNEHPRRDELTVVITVLDKVAAKNGAPCDLSSIRRLPWLRKLEIRDSCSGIEDLKPISGLTELRALGLLAVGLRDRTVYDVTPLTKLTQLEVLNSRNTLLASPEAIGRLTTLRQLTVGGTVKPLNIDFVAGLSALESLTFFDDDIEDPMPMASLPNLTALKLQQVRVDEVQLASFASAPKWVDLELTWVDIRSLAFVSKAKALKSLRMLGCQKLTTLDGIAGLPALNTLHAEYMDALSDISAVRDTQLVELNLKSSSVKDVAPLVDLPLTMLDLRGTKVTKAAPLLGMTSPTLELKLPKETPDALLARFKARHPEWTVYKDFI